MKIVLSLVFLIRQNGEGFITAEKLEGMFNPGRQRDIDSKFWKEIIPGKVKKIYHQFF